MAFHLHSVSELVEEGGEKTFEDLDNKFVKQLTSLA